MISADTLRQNLNEVRAEIARACAKCGRSTDEVRLIGVTKTLSAEAIQLAIDCGLEDCGENYIQELREKVGKLSPMRWHFIGHLQRNKAHFAVDSVSCIHSLDSLALIRTVDRLCSEKGKTMTGLLQVRLGDEDSKSGLDVAEVVPLLDELALQPLAALRLVGLMTVPPPVEEPDDNRVHFRTLRNLLDDIVARQYPFWQGRELSMGMSDDFAVAVEEGATMVRVGRAIFGARPPKIKSLS